MSQLATVPKLELLRRFFLHYARACSGQVFSNCCFTVCKKRMIQEVIIRSISKILRCQHTAENEYVYFRLDFLKYATQMTFLSQIFCISWPQWSFCHGRSKINHSTPVICIFLILNRWIMKTGRLPKTPI